MSDVFGDRMKEYEAVSDIKLTRKIPIILRLDGNSFSRFTQVMKFEKPYDQRLANAMWKATQAVLQFCGGAQIGYAQSDEITILLRNDMNPGTDPFLGNRLEKICSMVASRCSVTFCNSLRDEMNLPVDAIFDCRVFLVPTSEVNNAFLWRQQDAFKNCVSSVAYWGLAQKYGKKTAFKMLDSKGTNERQEIIFQELGININDYPTKWKRGVCLTRESVFTPIEELIKDKDKEWLEKYGKAGEIVERKIWTVDENIPLFNQDKEFIERFLK